MLKQKGNGMDKPQGKRIKRQPNGLLEPYTVMVQGNPRVVMAESLEDATKLAQEPQDENTEEVMDEEQLTEQE